MNQPRAARLPRLKCTYQGDGRGCLRFFYGVAVMFGGKRFKIEKAVARVFVDEMNSLDAKDLNAIGGELADGFYKKHLVRTIPLSDRIREKLAPVKAWLMRWLPWVRLVKVRQ